MADWRQLAARSIACRCPRCGKGPVFEGFIKVIDRCPECGLALAKNDNGDGPAVFLIFLIGFALVPPAVIVSMHVDWPLWLHGLLWGTLILGAVLGLLRPAKALTIGIQYQHRPEAFHD